MRALWTLALCGLMLQAPAMAQDSGTVVGAPAVAEEAPAATEDTTSVTGAEPSAADDVHGENPNGEALLAPEGKPGSEPSNAFVGPVAGYTYFHRAGATLADQRADLAACRPSVLAMTYPPVPAPGAAGLTTYDPQVYINSGYSPGAVAGAGVVLAIGAATAAAAAQRAAELRSMQLNYENCMTVRGWSVMVLDAEAGAHLDRLSERRLSEQLETMVGAASPFGSIGRRFNNEHHFAALDDIEEMSLSLRLLPDTYLAREMRSGNNMLNTSSRREERERAIRARERAQLLAEATEAARLAYAGRTLKAESVDIETMADLPEGSALIVIGVEGLTARLVRMNTQEGDGPDLIEPLRSGAMQAFVAPAGDWRLVSLWTEGVATSYCLGAPVLRVNAGDVVHAGSFDGHGVVDFALDDVRASLAARPELAERLQAGSYTNGSTFGCGSATYVTAYEIPSAPFASEYAFGSRAAGASAGAEP